VPRVAGFSDRDCGDQRHLSPRRRLPRIATAAASMRCRSSSIHAHCARGARRAPAPAPIEIVVVDPYTEHERIVGKVEPPQVHHGALRDIEFALRA
jgi:hypothetical protein